MFSFMKIATFAALTFGALASALPQPIASPDVNAIAARQASAPDVTTVLQNLANDLQAPVSQLSEFCARGDFQYYLLTELFPRCADVHDCYSRHCQADRSEHTVYSSECCQQHQGQTCRLW